MKKIILIIYISSLLIGCFGCTNSNNTQNKNSNFDNNKITSKENIPSISPYPKDDNDISPTNSPIPKVENSNLEKLESKASGGFEIIEDQTFEVELENWGKVRFVSGSYKVDEIPKLSLYLVDSNENIAYALPGFTGNMWAFYKLKAVAFKDVNRDGLKDIIIIADCILGHGENAANPFLVSSIYFQKGKEFVTIPELDNEIYYAKQNLNIDMILKYVERKNIRLDQ